MPPRAEESRLEFQKKQFQVKRLAKQQEYQRQLAEAALDRKNAQLDMVNSAKKESILQRKKVAQDFVVKKQMLKDEAERDMEGIPCTCQYGCVGCVRIINKYIIRNARIEDVG